MLIRRLIPMMDEVDSGGGFVDAGDDAEQVDPDTSAEQAGDTGGVQEDDPQAQPGNDDQQEPVYRTQQEFDEAFERRLLRERKAFERQLRDATAPYAEMTQLMKEHGGITGETPDEMIDSLRKFYAESGIEIPEAPASTLPDEDAAVLGQAKADRFLRDASLDDIRYEIQRLERLPEQRRTLQDAVIYKRLAGVMHGFKERAEFEQKYPKTDLNKLLEDKDFADFVGMTDEQMSISQKYEKYQALTAKKAGTPPSTGSVKAKGSVQDKAYFTPEEVEGMTPEEVKKNFDAINKSRLKW